jgi:hypothetical protein
VVAVVAIGLGCSAPHRRLTIVPTLAPCLGGAAVNTVRVSALGDFPPQAALTAAASAAGPAALELPRATRVVAVEGFGPMGLAAFGRTAPLALDDFGGDRLGVAYGPPDGLCATGAMQAARTGHHATRLGSGAVLVTGGFDGDGPATAIELYDPATAAFRLTGAALRPDAVLAHATATLSDGGALVTGGVGVATDGSGAPGGIAFGAATRYDARGQAVGPPVVLVGARAAHTATALPDGRVLLAGGCVELDAGACVAGRALATTEIYEPDADAFVAGPPLLHARWGHDAVLRGDGTVLLVGGRGEGGAALPAEVVDPNELRSFDAGLVSGRAAPLATGSVLVAGGVASADASVTLWLAPGEAPLSLPALAEPRRAPSLTPLDDGGVLLAGGGAGALYVYDGRGAVTALPAAFSATGHAATRLDDGTVLLAGGTDGSGAPTAAAALFFRSPLSAWSSLPPLTLDGPADPYLPRRSDRAAAAAGQLVITAPAASTDGRPAELALVAGMEVADFGFDLLAGRRGAGGAALLLGWRSEAAFAFVVVDPGRAVELWTVSSPRAGQSRAAPVDGCRGVTLDDAALPDGDLAPLHVDWRGGTLSVQSGARTLLRCRPPALPRGRVGVGALHGTVAFDNLALVR